MARSIPKLWRQFPSAAALALTLAGPARASAPEGAPAPIHATETPDDGGRGKSLETPGDPPLRGASGQETALPTRVRAFGLVASAAAEEDLDGGLPDWRAQGGAPDVLSLLEVEPRGWQDPRRPADEALFAASLGLGVAAGPLVVELELRQLNAVVDGHWIESVVALGPSVGVELGAARATFSYLPELASIAVCDPGILAPRSNDAPRHAARWMISTTF